jgi:NADP-dependent 3-hydroxy acid dehydrogenase YdfG
VLALTSDVTRREDLTQLITAARRFGRVDALVSNAGLMPLSMLRR